MILSKRITLTVLAEFDTLQDFQSIMKKFWDGVFEFSSKLSLEVFGFILFGIVMSIGFQYMDREKQPPPVDFPTQQPPLPSKDEEAEKEREIEAEQ